MKIKGSKGFVLLFLVLMIIFSASISFADTDNHWANEEIRFLKEKGVVSGYPDGSFRPDQNITRAEFIKTINYLVGYSEKGEVYFKDVKGDSWYYGEVGKAIKAKYINGYEDNTLRPDNPITRQEAAKIIAMAFGIENDELITSVAFVDNNQISNWAWESVNILKNKGYLSGYSDGSFRPNSPITRGEVVKIISNMFKDIHNVKGLYSKSMVGNVLINSSGTTLKDMKITGDLYLTEGIGDGEIILDNVTITGTIYIRSKGCTVIIKKGSEINSIKVLNKVNLYVEKGAVVEEVNIRSKDVEINADGSINSIVSQESYILNNKSINKNTEMIVKDGKIVGLEGVKKPDKPEKDDDRPTPPVTPVVEDLTARLDKTKYNIEDDLIITGRVLKDKTGLNNIDITAKLVDISGIETITVGQVKTNSNGDFVIIFKLPEGTPAGKYKVIVKANAPLNKSLELNLEVIGDAYQFTAMTNKVEYAADENIIISGTYLNDNAGLKDADITAKIVDVNGIETIKVEQVKTNVDGQFTFTLKMPEGTSAGKYRVIVKASRPIVKIKEMEILIK